MFVVLMSFALAASPAGGPPDGERGSGRPHGPPPPLPALVLHAAEDADLDAAQLDRLRALAGDARPGLEALHAEVEAAHQALGDLLSGEPPDTRALVAAGRSLTAAEGALRDGEMRLLGQMAVELGPDGWAAVTRALPAPPPPAR